MKINPFYTFLFICLIFIPQLNAIQLSHSDHYSTKDGLPQYTIMDIIQDQKGFMWFASWDGLSKFDGYRFSNYKVKSGDKYFVKSNRIEKIEEDKFNRIWFKSYDGEMHCFNPATESYWGAQLIDSLKSRNIQFSGINIQPSGKVWLTSNSGGCILIKDSVFDYQCYNMQNGSLKNNHVRVVFEDKELNSWILTDNGLTRLNVSGDKKEDYFFSVQKDKNSKKQSFYAAYDTGKEILFSSEKGKIWRYSKIDGKFTVFQTSSSSEITSIQSTSGSELLLVTRNNGLILLNTETLLTRYFNTKTTAEMLSDRIALVHPEKDGNLWYETEDQMGIFRLDLKNYQTFYYKVKVDDTFAWVVPPHSFILEDANGNVWVHPRGGGFSMYNQQTKTLMPVNQQIRFTEHMVSNILHSGYADKQGNLWLCSRTHGVDKVVFHKSDFHFAQINPADRSEIANEVRAVFEDQASRLWIATKDRKITLFDAGKRKLGCLSTDGDIRQNAFFPAMVYSMIQDKKGNIWIGTKGAGLYKFTKNISGAKYSVQHFVHLPNQVNSLSENSVYTIFEDLHGRIWVGTYGGGINLIEENNGNISFCQYKNKFKAYPFKEAARVRFITESKKGLITVGTAGGLIVFSSAFKHPQQIRFRHYTTEPNNAEGISGNDVHGICHTSAGEMFIATFGGGLDKVLTYDQQGFPKTFKSYNKSDGLPSDVILSVVEDEQGKLWISNENNLSRFDPEKETIETFAQINRLSPGLSFSEASTCRLKSNELIFGLSGGFLSFYSGQIINSKFKPDIVFSNLLLYNKIQTIGNESPLKVSLDNTRELRLNHKQNYFSIEYAALDYNEPKNILYAYKLDGFDDDWNYVQKQRIANYTNLPKGKYIFRVKSTNSEGVWMDNERQLKVVIMPSFWETGWAMAMYLLFVLGLLYVVMRVILTFYKLKSNIAVEKKISDMKLRFFTDISHEIRTPLTMITAPVEMIMNDEKTPENTKNQLKIIYQNTNRLLRLVNQILDFRKIQFMKIKVSELELSVIVAEIFENFSDIARSQKITYEFDNQADGVKVWVDPDCVDKILMNLLSNAFKFTPAGKKIIVRLKAEEKNILLEVQDEGPGLGVEKQKKLFTRFASFNADKSKPSTGIGLSMVKELVDKSGSRIQVKSEPGNGTIIQVIFPYGTNHLPEDVEIIKGESNSGETKKPDASINQVAQPLHSPQEEIKKIEKSTILIVEDDADLRAFIKTMLENDYYIYEAEDGEMGFELAVKYIPDFIVSDIMMPKMDGVEMLHKIRNDIQTSHIPVVLLTAKTNIESKLEGLESGADDYISKPFSVTYFKARISNLIQQRKHLQEIYNSTFTGRPKEQFELGELEISSKDKEIMDKVLHVIEDNIENFEFSVDDLCKSINMSRSAFFKKLKSLTGMGPLEFVRDLKMKRAAVLIASGQYRIKEVTYMVGIADTRYFAKCFKEKYGKTPMEYKSDAMHTLEEH